MRTYALYTYTCGDIQWSSTGPGRAAVVGYNAAGESFFNHALSGYSLIGDAVSCSVSRANRKKRQMQASNTNTISLSKLSGDDAETCCVLLVVTDPVTDNILMELNNLVAPCPPTLDQVEHDTARFKPQPGLPLCYVTMSKTKYEFNGGRRHSVARQCCYLDQNGNRYLCIY